MITCYPQADPPEEWIESAPAQYAVSLANALNVWLRMGEVSMSFDRGTVRSLLIQTGMLQGALHVAGRLAQPDPMLCPSPMAWAAQALQIDLDALFRRLVEAENRVGER